MNPFLAIGPGIVIAATGLGAGDLIAASVAGARFGTALLWVVVVGALLKFVLNENLARWQLSTSSTVVEALVERLPRFWSGYFLVYLLLWSFVVAAALMAACGLAIHALFPEISVKQAGITQSLVAASLVLVGRYQLIEWAMKFFIGLMFTVVIVCAILVAPDLGHIARGLFVPSLPENS
ncbi:MAG: Nramp family divalent metal transporter, partial [Gammaproteobacteria bacterium]